MVALEWGIVKEIVYTQPQCCEIIVEVKGNCHRTIVYPQLTGIPKTGDYVLINTTATRLKLGTGGVDFLVAIQGYENGQVSSKERGMKMKYSPLQLPLNMFEENKEPSQFHYQHFSSLAKTPVLIGELHSMLIPAAAVLHHFRCQRVTYIMTDHGALPMAFSNTVKILKDKGLIHSTITIGNAFGGDYECVNIYSALVTAVKVIKSQAVIITMGPGIYGTGTLLGFSGIELGHYVDAVTILDGTPIFIPRISFNDNRERHYGISHHSLVLLSHIIQNPCHISFPVMQRPIYWEVIKNQLRRHDITKKHKLHFIGTQDTEEILKAYGLRPKSMGRSYQEDKVFFEAAAASSFLALRYI